MPRDVWPARQPESIRCAEMAYAFSIGNARSNQAPTVPRSAKSLKLKKVLRFGQSGCLLERRGGAEAALLTYRQMPRYRRQARREMPSFFIMDWSVVRFMPRRAAAPAGPPITPLASRTDSPDPIRFSPSADNPLGPR